MLGGLRPEDLLGVRRVGKQADPPPAAGKRRTQARKPTIKYGIALYPTAPKPKPGKKRERNFRKSWAQTRIAVKGTNSNLNNMALTHWIRKDMSHRDYPYAKLNKKIRFLQYASREWKHVERACQHREHPGGPWSRQETDLLFKLCALYDLRFTVIHDRYNKARHELHQPRTMEELKDRFYTIQRLLVSLRNPNMTDKERAKHPHFAHMYKYKYACDRRENLNNMLNRQVRENRELGKLVEAIRKNKDAIRKKRDAVKNKRRQLREQRAFMHSRTGELRKQDCILTTGGIHGYNCGGGVLIRDTLRSNPVAQSGPLAGRPRGCVPKREKRRAPGVYNQDDDAVSQPIRWKVGCGPAECKSFLVQLPPPAEPERPAKRQKTGRQLDPATQKQKELAARMGHEMSVELERRLARHRFINQNDKKGPFDVASGVLTTMYRRIQEDMLSELCLEKMMAKRKAQGEALRAQYAKMQGILRAAQRQGVT